MSAIINYNLIFMENQGMNRAVIFSPQKLVRASIMAAVLNFLCIYNAPTEALAQADPFSAERNWMVENDLIARDISDPAVLKAMGKVRRHLFVDKSLWKEAHADYPLPIGDGQTISQPYIVALMTQSLKLRKEDKVLEVGTGSGYQAAVLAEIVQQVYSVEIVKTLAEKAQRLLPSLGYRNVKIKTGDGYRGWEEFAPFDAIIITCAVSHIPTPLVHQLRDGGRIVLPLGDSGLFSQRLVLGTKKGGKFDLQHITGVRFVPMVGESQKKTSGRE
jgi:protein-L-isoaspartate(D-aspartate) O-methyltransferase